MTDEQIIKALERCFSREFDESTCYECPFYTAEFDKRLEETVKAERRESIKEFAERLKNKSVQGFWDENTYVGVDDIDNLVKEMTEEKQC